MHVTSFGKFAASFGLIRGPCKSVAEAFLEWQQDLLRPWGMALRSETGAGVIGDVLNALYPRTVPIATKYLFWPLDEAWTLYFDNGANGTDAGPPKVLASRLHTEAIRVVMADEIVDPATKRLKQYGATILECHFNGIERRHIFAANDGGKWKFGQSGEPFSFENTAAYDARPIKARFTHAMLMAYLKELGVKLDGSISSPAENGPGYLLTKHGKMPASLRELHD